MKIKLDYIGSVKQAIEIVKLNGKVAENVSKDKNATIIGIIIIAIGGILSSIVDIPAGIVNAVSLILIVPIASIIFFFISIGIMHLLARLFGGKAKYIEYFRAESYAAVLGWLGILSTIPVLGGIINFLTSVWGIVVNVVILENVHKLTRKKAIIVVLIPIIGFLVVIGAIANLGLLNPNTFLP